MLAAGSTTFWEVYEPTCATSADFHGCLTTYLNSIEHLGTETYFVSLAHAWSSGPAAWLHEEILGIKPLSPGFKTVQIRPDLAGLEWARGTETTPKGEIAIDIRSRGALVTIDLPAGVDAYVSLPTSTRNSAVCVNGAGVVGTLLEDNTRTMIHLPQTHRKHYVVRSS